MSEKEVHEAQCQLILGRPYSEIHNFLDQYHMPILYPFTAHLHRKYFHHWEVVMEVGRRFGRERIWAAILHILEDCLSYVPNQRDYETGIVDEYGRPKDVAQMDTYWSERVKKLRTNPP